VLERLVLGVFSFSADRLFALPPHGEQFLAFVIFNCGAGTGELDGGFCDFHDVPSLVIIDEVILRRRCFIREQTSLPYRLIG